ncbi:BadF/BadG/BcrA/BcrD ATPase family protein [Rubrimonas cliftonensis]|uniref:BadF-type ATPase n=1 Tax=Rubrimonas cliftonensis TaxID=89524 RepID=A0A1H4B9A3_9RHOB|nr:BadF/BadG/BcrA/BcrD ATPase family protein [Rubrimonas cliftonensis]SEA44538.1 BadF-type ATPase [Rubrimonas cliftonensis]
MSAGAAWLAAADGGGSGLRLRLCAPDGARLAEATAGPASLTHGVEAARAAIVAALAQATAAAGLRPDAPIRLALALAGARSAARRRALTAGGGFGAAEVMVMTDGYASLLGAHGGGAGATVAIGTGVIAMARLPDGRVAEASGWGFPAGDEGGGAWIGLCAARALTRALDGRGLASPMTEAVAARIGRTSEQVAAWLLEAGPTDYAALAPAVAAAARDGDAAAAAMLDAAALETAQAVVALDRQALAAQDMQERAGPGAEDAPAPGEMAAGSGASAPSPRREQQKSAPDPETREAEARGAGSAAAPCAGGAAGPVALLGGLAGTLAPRLPAPLRARLVAPRGDALDGALMALRGLAPPERLPQEDAASPPRASPGDAS